MDIRQPESLDEMKERIKTCQNVVWRHRKKYVAWKDPLETMRRLSLNKEQALDLIRGLSEEDPYERHPNNTNPDNEDVWIFWKLYRTEEKEIVLYIKISSRAPGDLYIHSFHINEGKRSPRSIMNSKRKANSPIGIETR